MVVDVDTGQTKTTIESLRLQFKFKEVTIFFIEPPFGITYYIFLVRVKKEVTKKPFFFHGYRCHLTESTPLHDEVQVQAKRRNWVPFEMPTGGFVYYTKNNVKRRFYYQIISGVTTRISKPRFEVLKHTLPIKIRSGHRWVLN